MFFLTDNESEVVTMSDDNLERDAEGNRVSSAKDITRVVNSFLNEMEIALLKDVEYFKDNYWISTDVYDAFVSRNMPELDRLFSEDQDMFRNSELKSNADFARGDANARLPKWNGTHFKRKLKNRDFKHANSVAKSVPPVLLLGSPGIGKSDIVRSIAYERGYGPAGIVDVRLSQKEAIDMRGFPVPNRNTKSVDWFISSEWPKNPLSRGILFLDEITSAPKAVQVGAYELILDRKLGDVDSGGYELPPGWFICSAGNLASDDAVVEDISSALANRMLHLVMKVNVDNWLAWARKAKVHPCVQSFISDPFVMNGLSSSLKLHNMNTNPQKTEHGVSVPVVNRQQGWPSPRSWARVGTVLDSYEQMQRYEMKLGNNSLKNANRYANFKDIVDPQFTDETTNHQYIKPSYLRGNLMDSATLLDMLIGLVGFETGREFYNYYVNYTDVINSLKSLFSNQELKDSTQVGIYVKGQVNPMTVNELIESITTLLDSSVPNNAKESIRAKIGGHPLVYLYSAPEVIISRTFYDDFISKQSDPQQTYVNSLKNLINFTKKLVVASRSKTGQGLSAANVDAIQSLIPELLKQYSLSSRNTASDVEKTMATYYARAYNNSEVKALLNDLQGIRTAAQQQLSSNYANFQAVEAAQRQANRDAEAAQRQANQANKKTNQTAKGSANTTPNIFKTPNSSRVTSGQNFSSNASSGFGNQFGSSKSNKANTAKKSTNVGKFDDDDVDF